MARSLKKGPYIDEQLLSQVRDLKAGDRKIIKSWARRATITPEMIGFNFGVYNGKDFVTVLATEEMVGHKLGEFSPTTKFHRHGGKVQKEQEEKAAAATSAPAAAAAKSAPGPKKK
ncbi:MAG: 30S ribosomal protein S19 [Candidatus Wildermuthbacteria bacterium]|nr:30S ribosomal protein S19 [Candidatus Wildermuthbacteria bacterium]